MVKRTRRVGGWFGYLASYKMQLRKWDGKWQVLRGNLVVYEGTGVKAKKIYDAFTDAGYFPDVSRIKKGRKI